MRTKTTYCVLPALAGLLFAAGLAGCDEGSTDSRRPTTGRPCTSTCDGDGITDCEHPGVRTCGDYDGDGCFEWSAVTPCARACVAGQCVDCDNGCESGSLSCGATGGIRECRTDVNDDPCFEWAPEQACPEGQSCSGAQCRPAEDCLNECGQVGVPQCAQGENGYQLCQAGDADDCLHWGATVPCEQGETCSNGQCRDTCSDECAANSRDCEPGGFRSCGDFDDDDCLEWSAVTPCDEGQVCSNGSCADTCSNECGPEGTRQCSGNGYQVCARPEGGACLAWGPVKACGDGETCSNGRCRAAGCVNECALDTAQCQGNGAQTCGEFDDDDCTEWSAVVPCDEGETCSSGECSTRCLNECGVLNQRQCNGNGYQVCANSDEDACLEWGVVQACPAGQTCANGECAAQCVNACSEGSKQCSGPGFQSCGNLDEDPCLEWSAVQPCAEGQTCSGGECAAACGDECVRGNTRCAPGGLQRCGNHDDDPCTDWGSSAPCPQGQFCSNGACAAGCNDECSRGAKRCSGNGYETCGDYDDDDCREWSAATPCPPGQLCSNGACAAACGDECAAGTVQCAGNGFQSCGEHDADACKEWSEIVACPQGQTCSNGVCGRFCNDECEAGATRCGGGGVQACGNFDADACREWGAGVACPAGEVCSNGRCADRCENECNADDTRCRGGGVQACGSYDVDDCTEWSVSAPCPGGQVCDNGACVVFDPGCGADDDCPEGFICVGGVCADRGAGCQSDNDCAVGERCDALHGVCRPRDADHRVGEACAAEGDCGADLECFEGYCSTLCADDVPCPVGSSCYLVDPEVPDTGLCLRDCADAPGCEPGQACYEAAGPLGGACWAAQCQADADCGDDPILRMACIGGVCVAQNGCDPLTAEGCAAGELCVQYEGTGVCLTSCVQQEAGCAGGLKCYPIGEVEGLCVPAGPNGAGMGCMDDSECDAVTFCVDDGLGNGTCRPACDSWAAGDPCGAGQLCLSVGGRTGFCMEDCDNECDAGAERCSGNGLQQCGQADADACFEWADVVPCGDGQGCNELWAVCEPACMADGDCEANPFVEMRCVAGSCEVIGGCVPATGEGCEDFEICEPATPDGAKGVCIQPCDPLEGGCQGEGMRCGLFASGGSCVPAGALGDRDLCDSSIDCGAGLACLMLMNGESRCLPLCDEWDGDPGCGGDLCADLGIDTRVGVCIPCQDECVAGEVRCADEISIQFCDYVVADGICTGWTDAELCPDGEACDMENNTCRPWCDEDADCLVAGGGVLPLVCNALTGFCELPVCVPGVAGECAGLDAPGECLPREFDEGGQPVGDGMCAYSCDPLAPACEDGGYCDWYYLTGDSVAFVCLPAGDALVGESCDATFTCAPGGSCLPFDDGEGGAAWVCGELCGVGGDDCGVGMACAAIDWLGQTVGVCAPAQ